jgi:hypothetical protein
LATETLQLQYIENSAIALRAAHYTLAGNLPGLTVQLFPMIHIGSSMFFSAVQARLNTCDVVLYEGIRSPGAWILTLSYRIVARRKRLGLITQSQGLSMKNLRSMLLHADVDAKEFGIAWARIPWYWRLGILTVAPLFGVIRYLTATRESIGKHLSLEDVPSRNDTDRGDGPPGLEHALGASRDTKLIAALEAQLASAGRAKSVGVLYGAAHMKAVTDLLIVKYGFRVIAAEWLEVIDYVDA